MSFDLEDLRRTAPLLLLSAAGLVLLLLEAFSRVRLIGRHYHKKLPPETSEAYAVPLAGSRTYLMPLTVLFLAAALGLVVWLWPEAAEPHYLYRRMLVLDRFGLLLSGVCITAAAIGALGAPAYLREQRMEFGEYYALLLLSLAGMVMLVSAADLVSLLLGVETMSLGAYVLTGSWRRSPRSSEAAMKYFLMGAFVSAILLYGIALIYGSTGTTELAEVRAHLSEMRSAPVFYLGMFFLLAGLAFKIAAVPFHMWAPDVYEGAPTPVTGFMMAAVKTAAFGGLIRLCVGGLTSGRVPEVSTGPTGWVNVLFVLSALSMTLGNLAALRQENIKRLLAYSSIAHAGYLLVGVVALGVVGDAARAPLIYYLLGYAVTVVGAMAVVAALAMGPGQERLPIEQWAGLGQRHPAMALAMTLFLLSLGGFPPTAGFFGKFYLFRAALQNPSLLLLVLLAIVNSLVSVYYYLRIVTAMYFRTPQEEEVEGHVPAAQGALRLAVLLAALLVLGLGVWPGWAATVAEAAKLAG
ncbi:MAG: NADH-quinone oxidoreductase subunit N [Myxococcota bacterium]|nr:NADH-quinone oxidoreductase subunit N [Myxococcota bacterium]